MKKIKSIEDVVAYRLCIGCGACKSVLRNDSIQLVNYPSIGLRPIIKKPLTSEENELTLAVCPGIKVVARLNKLESRDQQKNNSVAGRFESIWIGHASEPEVRYRGSSGGVLTALSLYCLEKKGFDYIAHTKMNQKQPWMNKSTLSASRNDILKACGSRYSPSSPCDILNDIISKDGSFVFVGKPCDIAAVRMFSAREPELEKKIGMILTFFCAGTPSSAAVENLGKGFVGDKFKEISELHFRGNGWPGSFRMRIGNGKEIKYLSYEESWSQLQRSRSLRCHLCADGMGDLADIACGDAWHLYENDNNPGLSIIIARTERGRELIEAAQKDGYVTIKPVDKSAISAAQGKKNGIVNRRRAVWGRLAVFSIMGIPRTRYIGFPLFKAWLGLSILSKIKSIVGTLRRILHKKLFIPQEMSEEGYYQKNSNDTKKTISFLIPGRSRSGGVRVTVEMAEKLRERGHSVRILYPRSRLFSSSWFREVKSNLVSLVLRLEQRDWTADYSGTVSGYKKINKFSFKKDEVVIAVGTSAIGELVKIERNNIYKVRYCHGFSEHKQEEMKQNWGLRIPTVSVSPLLNERIYSISGENPIAVVPNGIKENQYFVEKDVKKNGIGFLFNTNRKKAPEDAKELAKEINKKFPGIPIYSFGVNHRPKEFPNKVEYRQMPSIEDARHIYNKALIWLVVSKSEGFCLPILEAMACGAAVISTDHDTVRGIINPDVNGVLVKIGDIKGFLDAIEKLLNNDELRSRLVKNGFETVREFTWDKSADAMERMLDSFK
ncbi:Coenzyme F420 hydrogenase/dehydrogenase, beta subunit C-terminal domain [Marispirochaeta sp.]|uniref:Coenzyme F420 hydrogenase/dehydrogenase, beta subunit C-terminal domain n=1 Tax=Marispirochaeta sp. TaxID=2038653 RepID=UPI0029C87E1F|nr:Coenzyme F420 hydrogenase/dehydrogenase, beta subunit C-terminal domain [Marispirochaeta sp.]